MADATDLKSVGLSMRVRVPLRAPAIRTNDAIISVEILDCAFYFSNSIPRTEMRVCELKSHLVRPIGGELLNDYGSSRECPPAPISYARVVEWKTR